VRGARRSQEFLRIWGSEMMNFLSKNAFQYLKSFKFSACGGLFSCLVYFTKYISEAELLQKRLRRPTFSLRLTTLPRTQRTNRFCVL
jgi:hypothetical protein